MAEELSRKNRVAPEVPSADQVMLAYVEALTLEPGAVESSDVESLRHAGFSDAAIADVALHTGLFALMNRIVDGLGGQLDPGMEDQARALGLPVHAGTSAGSIGSR